MRDARERREEARKLLASKIDPSANRKAEKAARAHKDANSFELITREWLAAFATTRAESHNQRLLRLFENDIFPRIGNRPIADLTPPELLAALRVIEARGARFLYHLLLASEPVLLAEQAE